MKLEEGLFSKPTKYGILQLKFTPNQERSDLAYYTHFTLSRIVNGSPQLLTFPEDATWSNTFSKGTVLEAGTYLLTTGNRLSNGSVLAHTTCFTINPDEIADTEVDLNLRNETTLVHVLGSINTASRYLDLNTGSETALLPSDGLSIIGFIAPNHEPTNHALRDISTYAAAFEQWGCPIILLSRNADEAKRLNKSEFNALPSTTVWGIDKDNTLARQIQQQLQLQSEAMPIFILVDKAGNIVFKQQGYTIHLGEQMLQVINRLGH